MGRLGELQVSVGAARMAVLPLHASPSQAPEAPPLAPGEPSLSPAARRPAACSRRYGYNWRVAEAEKNLLRTHTTAVSSRMLYRLAQARASSVMHAAHVAAAAAMLLSLLPLPWRRAAYLACTDAQLLASAAHRRHSPTCPAPACAVALAGGLPPSQVLFCGPRVPE